MTALNQNTLKKKTKRALNRKKTQQKDSSSTTS